MSAQHLDRLSKELVAKHWVIVEENSTVHETVGLYWKIQRPDGTCPLTLEFSPSHQGMHGGGDPFETIDRADGCEVAGHAEVRSLHFRSKLREPFQRDVVAFVVAINDLDKD
jgi:hypothetical protein